MQIIADSLYHVYNQGNNQERLFANRNDYLLFLREFRKWVLPHCDVLAYCLMPNHFHFLINTSETSVQRVKIGGIEMDVVTNGFRILLSKYAQRANEANGRTGSLFRPRTKAKSLEAKEVNYPLTCFQYIHQNPMRAGLVNRMEDWEFSSFSDYAGFRAGTLCNQELARQLLDLYGESFYADAYQVKSEQIVVDLFG